MSIFVDIHNIKNIVRKRKVNQIYIFGNAPNLNDIRDDFVYRLDRKILTIGLNRVYLKFIPDIIFYAHDDVYNYMKKKNIRAKYLYKFSHRETSIMCGLWKKHKSFNYLPKDKLFGYRNILIVVLHLAHILGIKTIKLFGVDLVYRNYFYDHKLHPDKQVNKLKNNNMVPYDHKINGGKKYLVQDLIREVLESLIEENFKIHFYGDSSFLCSINGLIRMNKNTNCNHQNVLA